MSVIPLTLTIGLCLVFTFVLFFIREQSRQHLGGTESEALLPLADERPRIAASDAHACQGNGSCAACRRRNARQQ